MVSARCAYCDATLPLNSMFCLECGQLVPQANRPPVPAHFTPPATVSGPSQPQAPVAPSSPIDPVPLPGSLPWQQAASGSLKTALDAAPVQPAAVEPTASSARRPVNRIKLTFSTGQNVTVGGNAVIGRKPAPTAQSTGAQAIEVLDDTRSMSRVHLFLDISDGVVTVRDAGSSNGSSVERAGTVYPLDSAGARVEVSAGDRVWVGDVSFDIAAA